MKKFMLCLSVLVVTSLGASFSFAAGRFTSLYTNVELTCSDATSSVSLIIEHELLSGVTSVTENVIVNGSLEDQIRRRFLASTLRDDSTAIARIIVSQRASESGPVGPNDPVVALFIKMDDLKGSSKFSGELEQGTLREIFDFTAAARNVQCVVNGHGDDSENGL